MPVVFAGEIGFAPVLDQIKRSAFRVAEARKPDRRNRHEPKFRPGARANLPGAVRTAPGRQAPKGVGPVPMAAGYVPAAIDGQALAWIAAYW